MALRVRLEQSGYEGLEIPANPYPMYPHVEVLNTVSMDSATGVRHVFTHGPKRVNALISFKCLSYDFAKKYEDFILNRAKLGQKLFRIVCPAYIDFGMGKGADIDEAQYSGPASLKDIITPHGDAGLLFDIELPYMFVRGS